MSDVTSKITGNDATPKIARNESAPWWLAGSTAPVIAYGGAMERGGYAFAHGPDATEFSTAIDNVMFWPRVLNDMEITHIYNANTDGKRCDCPLCTGGRKGATK